MGKICVQTMPFNPIYDIIEDPGQTKPVRDAELEKKLAAKMRDLLERVDAPESQFSRVGL